MKWSLNSNVQKDAYDKTVKTQYFCKNEDQNHTDEQSRLLSCPPYSRISYDPNCEASSQTAETDSQTCTKLHETPEKEIYNLECLSMNVSLNLNMIHSCYEVMENKRQQLDTHSLLVSTFTHTLNNLSIWKLKATVK